MWTLLIRQLCSVERNGDEKQITLKAEWSYSDGAFLEAGHPANGQGCGWYCDAMTAVDGKGAEIELTREEQDQFCQQFHPNL